MGIIYNRLLKATVRIDNIDNGEVRGMGPGFLLLYSVSQENHILLVSNKHVFKHDTFNIKFSLGDDPVGTTPSKTYTHTFTNLLENVIKHPDPNVDLAIVPFGGALNEIQHLPLQFFLISSDKLMDGTETWIHIGSSVYFVGYPFSWRDEVNNLPLMRCASLATCPSVNYENNKKILIDGHVFNGSSGSPVFAFNERISDYRLVGVVSGVHMSGTENSFLGIVEKVNGLNDLIEEYSNRL